MDKPRGAPPPRQQGQWASPGTAQEPGQLPRGCARPRTFSHCSSIPHRSALCGAHAMGNSWGGTGSPGSSAAQAKSKVESSRVEGAGAGQLSGRLCGRQAPSQGFWLSRHPGAASAPLSRPGLVTATSGLRCPAWAIRMPVTFALSAGRTQVCCKLILPRAPLERVLFGITCSSGCSFPSPCC